MYLHLGRDYVVHTGDILGIFDLESTTLTRRGREFLEKAQTQGAVVSLSEDIPRSFVLTDWPTDTVFLSSLSAAALTRRTATFSAAEPDGEAASRQAR